jgi:TetR/AcrR family transcriptional regulator, cholesterol catabolism regulator
MKAEAPTPRVVDRNRTQSIYLKAAEIFHRKGFDATSMDDIARALQITKAGLYYYIKGKEDLLFAIMTYAMDWLSSEVVEPARTVADPEQRLRLIIERHGRELMEGPRSLAILSDEVAALTPKHRRQILKRKREYFDLIRDTLEEVKALGRLADVDTTVTAFSILGALMWLPRWYRPEGALSSDRVVDEITRIVLGGALKPRP